MTFLYAARGTFDKNYGEESREKYIEWSKLKHLTELVSLDGMLNENLVEPDYHNADDWNFIYSTDQHQTDFFTTQANILFWKQLQISLNRIYI
ncbi:MAG: hypothetical protein LH629_16215 [Ignavibacteria bacterium]|nr:hypothetical protein [Ignavibacteria bacterium]